MAYLLTTTLIWAFSFGLIGHQLQGLNPLLIAALRLLTALLVFLPLLRKARLTGAERGRLLWIGGVQFGVMYVAYISAFQFIPSHLVALFSVLTPLYVVLIHDLQRRKLNRAYLGAAALSVCGASVIRVSGSAGGEFWTGFALMQLSGLAFAYGQVAYRDWKQQRPNVKDHEIFAWLYAGGAAVATIALLGTTRDPAALFEISGQQLGLVVYLGAVASGLGFFLWNKGATRCSAGVLAAFNNALVPLAVAASLFVFGEIEETSRAEMLRLAIGAALIALAVLFGKCGTGPGTARP